MGIRVGATVGRGRGRQGARLRYLPRDDVERGAARDRWVVHPRESPRVPELVGLRTNIRARETAAGEDACARRAARQSAGAWPL